jgi:hypothetical protein
MSGITDLEQLLASMSPVLDPETYVFATLPDQNVPLGLAPLMVFQEVEGTTLILTKAHALNFGIAHQFECRRITLNVHSALEAVGFIARIASALAAAGMGVNPVAGFFHDHIFVPAARAVDAMELLADITRNANK